MNESGKDAGTWEAENGFVFAPPPPVSTFAWAPAAMPTVSGDALRDVARRLDGFASAPQFESLAAAVDGRAEADAWSQVDPTRVIDADAVARELAPVTGTPGWVTIIEVIRNALILVPVLVTWYGIHLAVNAYSALLAERPELSQQTFLFLWQRGFNGRTDLTLGRLAQFDAFLIIAVIVLTVAHAFLVHRYEARGMQQQEDERDDLRQLLGSATLALASRRPLTMSAAVGRLEDMTRLWLTDMRQERERMGLLVQRQTQQAEALAAFARHLPEMVTRISDAATTLQSSAARLEASFSGMTDATNKAGAGLESLNRSTTALFAKIEQVLDSQRVLSEGVSNAIGRAATAGAQLNETLVSLGRDVVMLNTAGDQIRLAAQSVFDGQGNLLQALGNERDAQANLVGVVASAATNLETALAALHDAGRSLRSLAVDAGDLTRDLPTLNDLVLLLRQATAAQHRAAQELGSVDGGWGAATTGGRTGDGRHGR